MPSILSKKEYKLLVILLLSSNEASSISIEFDYSYDTHGLFTDEITGAPIEARRSLLNTAASFYAGFSDNLTPITPQSKDSWSVSIGHPSSTGSSLTLDNLNIDSNTIRIYVGGSPSAPGVLAFAGTGFDLTANGSTGFVDAVNTRGQLNTTGQNASDYGVWGGSIWFNSGIDWYFNESSAGLVSQSDFLTTATHEIGHILGFGKADSWFSQIVNGVFTGTASITEHGLPVTIGQNSSHWGEGTMSFYSGMEQETLMDPNTPFGQRQLPTDLDYAGFADIGWQVAPVPLPPALWLFGIGLVSLMGATRHR